MHRFRTLLLLVMLCTPLLAAAALPQQALAEELPVYMGFREGPDGYGCVDHYRWRSYWGYSFCGGLIENVYYKWEKVLEMDPPAFFQASMLSYWDGSQWVQFADMFNNGTYVTISFYRNHEVYRTIRQKFYPPDPLFLGWRVEYDAEGNYLSDPLTRSIANGQQYQLCAGGYTAYCP